MDFAVPVDHKVKIDENKKKDKYLNLVRELRKLWNMRITVIPIVISLFGMVPKRLERGHEFNRLKISWVIQNSFRYSN